MTDYDLGILWALGGHDNAGRFVMRCKNKYFLEQIQKYTNCNIYEQATPQVEKQYVLKFASKEIDFLKSLQWSSRKSNERMLPTVENYSDFLRAYFEIHCRLDYSTRHLRHGFKDRRLRLKIYGNAILMQNINELLNRQIGVGLKSIQCLSNGKTAILSYACFEEIEKIFDFISGDPKFDPFWEDINKKMQNPIIKYDLEVKQK